MSRAADHGRPPAIVDANGCPSNHSRPRSRQGCRAAARTPHSGAADPGPHPKVDANGCPSNHSRPRSSPPRRIPATRVAGVEQSGRGGAGSGRVLGFGAAGAAGGAPGGGVPRRRRGPRRQGTAQAAGVPRRRGCPGGRRQGRPGAPQGAGTFGARGAQRGRPVRQEGRNRREAFRAAPAPGLLGGVVPVAPVGYNADADRLMSVQTKPSSSARTKTLPMVVASLTSTRSRSSFRCRTSANGSTSCAV